MAYKVSLERMEVFPHLNSDFLEIAKVGEYDLVVKKGVYKTGDKIIFIPKRSVISNDMKHFFVNERTGVSLLTGKESNIVSSILLRGALSEGVTIGIDPVKEKLGINSIDDMVIGEDISEKLGIYEKQPFIPINMRGKIKPLPIKNSDRLVHHDCFSLATSYNYFSPDDEVVIAEKLNGSQINLLFPSSKGIEQEKANDLPQCENRKVLISTKGMVPKDLYILEPQKKSENIYWDSFRNSNLGKIVGDVFSEHDDVHIMGEVVTCKKGFSYGFKSPTLKIYRINLNGEELSLNTIREKYPSLLEHWVPILYEGKLPDYSFLEKLSGGKEQVSGKKLHIKEGVIMSHKIPRKEELRHKLLMVKIINKKHKDKDDSFS